jgi:purine-binding chemotaxis protein CheW
MTTEFADAAISHQVIVFQLNDEEFALDVSQVKSIERIQPVTRVPGTASFVKGVINLRGVITPVIDLNERFGSGEEVNEKTAKIIIAGIDDVEAGLIVDEANDVIDILAESIEAPPEAEGNVSAEYIKGVAKHNGKMLILLNLDKVLNPEELRAPEKQ